MDKKATGELIRAARTEKGYTQSELGNILGVSNKAVSRWENGDSFPDIGILENLSSTLNIEIEALITGEKNNAPSTHILHELLRIAKIQAIRKSQSFIWGIAGAVILIFLLISGYFTMIANHTSLPWLLYCGSLLLFSIFFVVKSKIQVQSLLPSEKKTRKLIPSILIALLLYQIVSYGLICLSTTSDPLARLLQNLPLGFLLNLQLIAGYLIGLLILIITYIRSINQQCKTAVAPLLANGLVHLCLIYSDLLHRLTDVSQFAGHYALGTGLVVIIILINFFL